MADRVELDLRPVRWDRAVWEEGDVEGAPMVFLFEMNVEGNVLRQVELAGPDQTPIAAASAAEWWEAQGWVRQAATPATIAYEQRFGGLAEGSLHEWGPDYPGQQVSSDEFERAWTAARQHLSGSADT
ncbi:MAG: hypothetical protein JNK12_16455 [Acidimicrobiales bacterium]|nr:hypothetical protein [Acidimicrobiales bacterium]